VVTRTSVEYATEGCIGVFTTTMFLGGIGHSVLNEVSIYVLYYLLMYTGEMSVGIGL
jgi:hypothetical protein